MPSVADLTAKYYSQRGNQGQARPLLLLVVVVIIMRDAQKFLVFGFNFQLLFSARPPVLGTS